MYFSAPATVTGGFTITLNVQLGTGATADHWKVEMLDFNPTTGGWVLAGFLTGGTRILVPVTVLDPQYLSV